MNREGRENYVVSLNLNFLLSFCLSVFSILFITNVSHEHNNSIKKGKGNRNLKMHVWSFSNLISIFLLMVAKNVNRTQEREEHFYKLPCLKIESRLINRIHPHWPLFMLSILKFLVKSRGSQPKVFRGFLWVRQVAGSGLWGPQGGKKERAKKRIKREEPYPFSIKPKSFLPTLHRVSGVCVCVCVCGGFKWFFFKDKNNPPHTHATKINALSFWFRFSGYSSDIFPFFHRIHRGKMLKHNVSKKYWIYFLCPECRTIKMKKTAQKADL